MRGSGLTSKNEWESEHYLSAKSGGDIRGPRRL